MGKVLVKGIGAQYPASGGPPIMVASGGGNEKARGKTFREKLGGMAGGVLGALGSLAGQHRSLGGLAQSAISGGVQGKQLGQGLGRSTVTREGQARANIREDNKQKVAVQNAKLAEQARSRGQGPMSRFNPMAAMRRKNTAVKDAADANLVAVNRRNANPVVTPYKPPQVPPSPPQPPVPIPNPSPPMVAVSQSSNPNPSPPMVAVSQSSNPNPSPPMVGQNAAGQPVQTLASASPAATNNIVQPVGMGSREGGAADEINDIESASETPDGFNLKDESYTDPSAEQQAGIEQQTSRLNANQGSVIAGGDPAKGKAAMMAKLNQWRAQGRENTPQYAELWQTVKDME